MDSDICMFMAITEIGCPWHDDARTIKTSGMWGQVLKLGFFTVEATDFPDGFLITLLSQSSNKDCISHNRKPINAKSEKQVTLSVQAQELNYVRPVTYSVLILLVIAFVITIVWVVTWYVWKCQLDEAGETDGQCMRNTIQNKGCN